MRGALAVLSLGLVLGSAVFADDVVLPDEKAKKLVENTCTECHGLDQVVNSQMSNEDWRKTVNRMVKKGATLSPEEIDSVVEYLSVYFALDKVNVNSATSQQLQSALQLSGKDADAIVQYRKANGNFADMNSLLKVTGVDATRLTAKKDQISF